MDVNRLTNITLQQWLICHSIVDGRFASRVLLAVRTRVFLDNGGYIYAYLELVTPFFKHNNYDN